MPKANQKHVKTKPLPRHTVNRFLFLPFLLLPAHPAASKVFFTAPSFVTTPSKIVRPCGKQKKNSALWRCQQQLDIRRSNKDTGVGMRTNVYSPSNSRANDTFRKFQPRARKATESLGRYDTVSNVAKKRGHDSSSNTRNHDTTKSTNEMIGSSTKDDICIPPPPPGLTVILPAYNEAERILGTLECYTSYLNQSIIWGQNQKQRQEQGSAGWEVIVVDDGSEDDTVDIVNRFCFGGDALAVGDLEKTAEEAGMRKNDIRCISLERNEGKGAAIARGIQEVVLSAKKRGHGDNKGCDERADFTRIVLIADADGSGDMTCLEDMIDALSWVIVNSNTCPLPSKLEESFWSQPALVVGNRGYTGSSLSRSILRWGFRTAVRIVVGDLQVRDSQCGFKVMSLSAALQLYNELHLKRWTNDVEVLYRAREWNIPVKEWTVPWVDKDGSKLVQSIGGTIGVSIVMLLEVLWMRIAYVLGLWTI